MRLEDSCYPVTTKLLQLADQVEYLQEMGRCEEQAAALVVVAAQIAELTKALKGGAERDEERA